LITNPVTPPSSYRHPVSRIALARAGINHFFESRANSRPFEGIADPDKTLKSLKRGHQVLGSASQQRSRFRSMNLD
jgi:hypothetical protein